MTSVVPLWQLSSYILNGTSNWNSFPYILSVPPSGTNSNGSGNSYFPGYAFSASNHWFSGNQFNSTTGLPNQEQLYSNNYSIDGVLVKGAWFQLIVNTGIYVGSFRIKGINVKSFQFAGSNDAVNFTLLGSSTNAGLVNSVSTTFNTTKTGSFKYFRIVITEVNIGTTSCYVGDVNFFLVRPTIASNNLNLYSAIDGSGLYSTYNAVVDSTGVAITTSKKVNNSALNFQFKNADARTVADLVDWLYTEKARTGAEITNRIAGDLANATARTSADTALGVRVTDETSARTSADTALGVRITTLTTDRSTSDTNLTTSIATEVSTRTSADTALGGRIDTEANDRAVADGALTGRINTAVLNRQSGDAACVAAKNTWWNPLYTTIRPALGTLEVERVNGDNALGLRIDQEILDRIAGDLALGGRITDETTAREAADTALGGRITDETAARVETDTALVTSIASVKAAREAAVLAQKLRIDAILDGSPANLDSLAELVTAYSALNTGKSTKVAAFTGDCRSLKTIVSDLRDKVYQAFGADVPDVTPTFPNFT